MKEIKEILEGATKPLLAIIVIVGFFATLRGLFTTPLPENNSQMANTVIVALISIVSMAFGYYFGSSANNNKKTEPSKGEPKE